MCTTWDYRLRSSYPTGKENKNTINLTGNTTPYTNWYGDVRRIEYATPCSYQNNDARHITWRKTPPCTYRNKMKDTLHIENIKPCSWISSLRSCTCSSSHNCFFFWNFCRTRFYICNQFTIIPFPCVCFHMNMILHLRIE